MVESPARLGYGRRHEDRTHHWLLFWLWPRNRAPLPRAGWNVVATMRTPREDVLPRSARLRMLALDVTKPESIAAALEASGPIDVLVNNAGIGLFGAFEATPMATVREVFETNTFGMMAMTQAALPQFRARRSGLVVNVTSSATLAPMPMVPTPASMAFLSFRSAAKNEIVALLVGCSPWYTSRDGSQRSGSPPSSSVRRGDE